MSKWEMEFLFVTGLFLINIPIFIFLGWLAFDSKEEASRTFSETIVDILKIIFIPDIVRVMLDIETDKAIGVVPILGYFFACGALFIGELYLLDQFGFLESIK